METKAAEWRVIDEFYFWNSQRWKDLGYDSGLARLAEAVQQLRDLRAGSQVKEVVVMMDIAKARRRSGGDDG